MREGGDVAEVMFAVRSDLLRNLGNMTNRCGGAVVCGCAGGVCAVVSWCGGVVGVCKV